MMNESLGKPNQHRTVSPSLAKKILHFREFDFRKIKDKLQVLIGVKLDGYREEYLIRRISYHFNKSFNDSLDGYFRQLSEDKEFLNELVDCLTVNLSYFFRDKTSFDYLQKEILSDLLKRFDNIRVWSMGCSVGAEIYSIAMILQTMNALNRSELIATDNDSGALIRAVKGQFTAGEMRNVTAYYKKFFSEISQSWEEEKAQKIYALNPLICQSVTFAKHDLTSCLPLGGRKSLKRFHLLVCRNVMIYFNKDIKEKLYEMFYEWLEPGGILFVGANELVTGPAKTKFKMIQNQFYIKPIINS
jgi:chemotaxis protein methyltransferase CheR